MTTVTVIPGACSSDGARKCTEKQWHAKYETYPWLRHERPGRAGELCVLSHRSGCIFPQYKEVSLDTSPHFVGTIRRAFDAPKNNSWTRAACGRTFTKLERPEKRTLCEMNSSRAGIRRKVTNRDLSFVPVIIVPLSSVLSLPRESSQRCVSIHSAVSLSMLSLFLSALLLRWVFATATSHSQLGSSPRKIVTDERRGQASADPGERSRQQQNHGDDVCKRIHVLPHYHRRRQHALENPGTRTPVSALSQKVSQEGHPHSSMPHISPRVTATCPTCLSLLTSRCWDDVRRRAPSLANDSSLSTTADAASSGTHLVRVRARRDREACEPDAPHRDGARSPLGRWLLEDKTARMSGRRVVPSFRPLRSVYFAHSHTARRAGPSSLYCRSRALCVVVAHEPPMITDDVTDRTRYILQLTTPYYCCTRMWKPR